MPVPIISEVVSEVVNTFGGCFSPYMFITSITQGVFAKDRRSLQEQMNQDNMEFEAMINRRHELYDAEIMAHRREWMQQRLTEMRRTRAEQSFALHKIQLDDVEVEAFIKGYLPICDNAIRPLLSLADSYKQNGYSQDKCPLQILLLHTKHRELNKYIDVYDYLDELKGQIKNVEFPRWCEENAEQNVSILNLHAIMKNIPTVVISPYYQASSQQLLFTIAMWEAQSDTKPVIVPIFSMECNPAGFIDKNADEKCKLISQISKVCAILSGCARDIYMLYAFSARPTLPSVLARNEELVNVLKDEKFSELKKVVINEYAVAAKSLGTQCGYIKSVAQLAFEAQALIIRLS